MAWRVTFRATATDTDGRLLHYQQDFAREVILYLGLGRIREEFDRYFAVEFARLGVLYGSTIGRREARTRDNDAFREDGDWLDVELFPPDPMETLANDVSRVLADRERALRRAESQEDE